MKGAIVGHVIGSNGHTIDLSRTQTVANPREKRFQLNSDVQFLLPPG